MIRFQQLLLIGVALTSIAVAPACSGGGDDDDDDGSSPSPTPTANPTPLAGSVEESEPNDDFGEATVLTFTSDGNFHGFCATSNDAYDIFEFTLNTAGTVSVSLAWIGEEEPSVNDLDLYLFDSAQNIVAEDYTDPLQEQDSPAEVSAVLTTAGGSYFIEVECYNGEDVFYQGTLDLP